MSVHWGPIGERPPGSHWTRHGAPNIDTEQNKPIRGCETRALLLEEPLPPNLVAPVFFSCIGEHATGEMGAAWKCQDEAN